MGDNAAETLSEIEATRQRLESDIDALAARLPERDELVGKAKVYGGAAAGAGVGLVGLVVALKKRSATKERQRHARETAEALAEILHALPDETRVEADVERSSSRAAPLAVVAVLAGVGFAVATRLRSRPSSTSAGASPPDLSTLPRTGTEEVPTDAGRSGRQLG